MITVLTGERHTGKTSLCHRVANTAAARGWDVAGVISPAVFHDGAKAQILVTDLRSGRSRLLAGHCSKPHPGSLGYQFDDAVLAWADSVVATSSACDLLINDELGP